MSSQLAFTFPLQPDSKTLARTAREAAAVKPLYTYAEGARIRLNHNQASSTDWGALAGEAAISANDITDSDLFATAGR